MNDYEETNYKWDVRVLEYQTGTLHYIGQFKSLNDAKNAAEKAAIEIHGKPVIKYINCCGKI